MTQTTFFTVKEASRMVRKTIWSLYQGIHNGRLKASKFGRQWIIDEGDLFDWADSLRIGRPREEKKDD